MFNISRSRNRNYVLLNGKQIFPTLATSPHPPVIFTAQVAPNYTRVNLDDSIACSEEVCRDFGGRCWCIEPSLGVVLLDYDYSAKQLDWDSRTLVEKWEVTFDALGDPVVAFNRSDQLMLRITVEGRKRMTESVQTEASLFEPAKSVFEIKYDLKIASVELVKRSYTFPSRGPRTVWAKVRHFFGCDIVGEDGHIVYRDAEWDAYGQYGTLKNEFGKIVHDWPWDIVFIVIGSVLGGALVLYAIYRLALLVMQQRELARWDGMDAVWERLREERSDEDEGDGLLEGGYRDYADDDTLYGYTDEVIANKPLPAKPLPEKPLPAIPLIDA